MSSSTRIWPSQATLPPMPMVGISTAAVMRRAGGSAPRPVPTPKAAPRRAPPPPVPIGPPRAPPRIILDRSPLRRGATLSAERADGVDRLWREADMAHGRHAALDQKGDGLGHAAAALELDRSAAGLLHHPRRRHEGLLLG